MTMPAIINTCIVGDNRDVLPTLESGSVQCCVTSPPYWGLRDYGMGAQLGLESTPEEYVANMVQVFREVKRVLRDDGTLWLNLASSYYGGGWKGSKTDTSGTKQGTNAGTLAGKNMNADPPHDLYKSKDLVPIPWLVAMALQADGWYLRQDIIWHKPNPMPESVTDRCTKSHEYIFLLSKSARYYFDADAIAEPMAESSIPRMNYPRHGDNNKGNSGEYAITSKQYSESEKNAMRNKRSVWTVTTKPFSGAHFATFPPDLIEPCILAGSKPGDTVLDPFGGSGTTGMVAEKLGRNWVLIELNPEYEKLSRDRTAQTGMVFE